MNHGYVYILGSALGADRRTYVGWSVDIEARLALHNAGLGARSTRGRALGAALRRTLPNAARSR